jgi:hypothetical protein
MYKTLIMEINKINRLMLIFALLLLWGCDSYITTVDTIVNNILTHSQEFNNFKFSGRYPYPSVDSDGNKYYCYSEPLGWEEIYIYTDSTNTPIKKIIYKIQTFLAQGSMASGDRLTEILIALSGDKNLPRYADIREEFSSLSKVNLLNRKIRKIANNVVIDITQNDEYTFYCFSLSK